MKRSYIPDRGDLVWIDLDPIKGREQRGVRPAIVLSPIHYNQKSELALVCPITSKPKGYPFEVLVLPGPGQKIVGAVLADQIRCLSWTSRTFKFQERAPQSVIDEVVAKLGALVEGDLAPDPGAKK